MLAHLTLPQRPHMSHSFLFCFVVFLSAALVGWVPLLSLADHFCVLLGHSVYYPWLLECYLISDIESSISDWGFIKISISCAFVQAVGEPHTLTPHPALFLRVLLFCDTVGSEIGIVGLTPRPRASWLWPRQSSLLVFLAELSQCAWQQAGPGETQTRGRWRRARSQSCPALAGAGFETHLKRRDKSIQEDGKAHHVSAQGKGSPPGSSFLNTHFSCWNSSKILIFNLDGIFKHSLLINLLVSPSRSAPVSREPHSVTSAFLCVAFRSVSLAPFRHYRSLMAVTWLSLSNMGMTCDKLWGEKEQRTGHDLLGTQPCTRCAQQEDWEGTAQVDLATHWLWGLPVSKLRAVPWARLKGVWPPALLRHWHPLLQISPIWILLSVKMPCVVSVGLRAILGRKREEQVFLICKFTFLTNIRGETLFSSRCS